MLVLVVDDEPMSRMAHLGLLAKIRGITAVGVGTVAEARTIIKEAPPQMIVLDMRLPDGTGLDVIAALQAAGSNAIVVVVTAYVDDYRAQLGHSERVHLMGKPVHMRDLQQLVERSIQSTETLGPFSILDYVQIACMGHHSAVIECKNQFGRGEIIIDKGDLWSAQDGLGAGVAAFERLVNTPAKNVRAMPERRWRGPRNLEERWELIVLDALRTRDEALKKGPLVPANQPAGQNLPAEHKAPPVATAAPQAAPPAAGSAATKPAAAGAAAATGTPSASLGPLSPSSGVDPASLRVPVSAPIAAAIAAAVGKGPMAPAATLSSAAAATTAPRPAATAPSTAAGSSPAAAASPPAPAPSPPTPEPSTATGTPDQFDACVERALRAVVAKNFALAISEFEKAQAMRPTDPIVRHRLERLRALRLS